MVDNSIKEEFKRLVKSFGENNKIKTFQLCSDYGIEIEYSTIDSIWISQDGDIVFSFNDNENDEKTIDEFVNSDLEKFYKDLLFAIAMDREKIIRWHEFSTMRDYYNNIEEL